MTTSLKVLVVDDQEINRSLLQHMLKHNGYEVVLAEDGLQAIEIYKSEQPDLILLDVVMPNLDGYETAPILKKLAGEVYLPIIFITALDDQDSLTRCLDVGGDDFLNKPFDRVILHAKIKAHSRSRELSKKTFEQKKQLDFYRLQTEREHLIVEHIFERALEGNYQAPHLLDYHLSPASMFNGDIMLVALGPTGNLYIMMGDFTGHGLAAAVGTIPASRTFYSLVKKGVTVGDIAFQINEVLLKLLPDDMFCAASIIELQNTGHTLSIWAGGTPDMYLLNSATNELKTIHSQHMALGILETDEFESTSTSYMVSNKEKLIMFTDGVVELTDKDEQMFGYKRLIQLLTNPDYTTLDTVIDKLNEFSAGVQDDDISILSLRCDAVNSDIKPIEHHYSKLSHSFTLTLDADAIKSSDPVLELLDIISQIKGAEEHRSNLYLLLSEAYNNALEHGLLGLDSAIKDDEDGFLNYYLQRDERLSELTSGEITISSNYVPEETTIYLNVTDSGKGFNTNQKELSFDNNNLEHGRGYLLVNELASSVEYNEAGNKIKIGYQLNSNSTQLTH